MTWDVSLLPFSRIGISYEEEDIMFVTKLQLFLIGTIVIPKPIRLEQHVSSVSLTSFELVE